MTQVFRDYAGGSSLLMQRLRAVRVVMIDYLRRLITHLQWADERVLVSLRRAAGPPAKAVELYAHIVGAEQVWLARLRDEPATMAVWPSLTLDECATRAGQTHEALARFVWALSTADLEREVAYVNSAGAAFRSRIDDILTQIATHGVYHRAQIAMLLREAGAEPEPTDFIAFVRGVPAATRRP